MIMATSTIKRNGMGAPTEINLNNEWTAPSDGLINVYLGWQAGESYGYMYIKDITTDSWVCAISNPNNLAGFASSTMFPVIKGHQYKVEMSSKVGSLVNTFYAL